MSLPPIGSPAPDFTLPATDGTAVTLSALRGQKVLLAFFPLAFTSTCTVELCAFSEDYSAFAASGARVLPISVDSIPTLRAFQRAESITVPLLSDFKREVCRQYGTLIEEAFLSARAYVVIDAQGIVRWTWQEAELGHYRQNAELLTQLQAA